MSRRPKLECHYYSDETSSSDEQQEERRNEERDAEVRYTQDDLLALSALSAPSTVLTPISVAKEKLSAPRQVVTPQMTASLLSTLSAQTGVPKSTIAKAAPFSLVPISSLSAEEQRALQPRLRTPLTPIKPAKCPEQPKAPNTVKPSKCPEPFKPPTKPPSSEFEKPNYAQRLGLIPLSELSHSQLADLAQRTQKPLATKSNLIPLSELSHGELFDLSNRLPVTQKPKSNLIPLSDLSQNLAQRTQKPLATKNTGQSQAKRCDRWEDEIDPYSFGKSTAHVKSKATPQQPRLLLNTFSAKASRDPLTFNSPLSAPLKPIKPLGCAMQEHQIHRLMRYLVMRHRGYAGMINFCKIGARMRAMARRNDLKFFVIVPPESQLEILDGLRSLDPNGPEMMHDQLAEYVLVMRRDETLPDERVVSCWTALFDEKRVNLRQTDEGIEIDGHLFAKLRFTAENGSRVYQVVADLQHPMAMEDSVPAITIGGEDLVDELSVAQEPQVIEVPPADDQNLALVDVNEAELPRALPGDEDGAMQAMKQNNLTQGLGARAPNRSVMTVRRSQAVFTSRYSAPPRSTRSFAHASSLRTVCCVPSAVSHSVTRRSRMAIWPSLRPACWRRRRSPTTDWRSLRSISQRGIASRACSSLSTPHRLHRASRHARARSSFTLQTTRCVASDSPRRSTATNSRRPRAIANSISS